MDEQLYREIILEHFKNPQNYGVINHADLEISDYNPLCGDEIRLTVVFDEKKILDIKFVSTGCAISKASASILTEYVKQKTKDEFLKITPEKYLELLEIELSPSRIKCALLSYSALKKGLKKNEDEQSSSIISKKII